MSFDPSTTTSSFTHFEDVATPQIYAFMTYWRDLKGDRVAPSWDEFDLAALSSVSIPNVVVVDVRHDPLDFIIRFWGTGHVRRKGVDKTGKSINDKPDFRGQAALDEYEWVVRERLPLASRGIVNLHDFSGLLPFEQRLVRLPLSNDGARVDHIVSLAVWETA